MINNKPTYNEIMNALECCWHDTKCVGDECPFFEPVGDCVPLIAMETIDIINNQNAEIERLNKELSITRSYIHDNGLEFDLLSYYKRNGG